MKYNQKLYVSYVKYLSVTVGDKKMPKNAKKKKCLQDFFGFQLMDKN